MEFQLPKSLAEKLVSYDQVLKLTKAPVQQGGEQRDDKYLKRRSKLAFPCPDIFFDLSLDLVHEIYDEFCRLAIPYRERLIYSEGENRTLTHLVVWQNFTDFNDQRIQRWVCWKIGDIDCPVIMREWDTNMECDQYGEDRADQSYRQFRNATENPFSVIYKKEKIRYRVVNRFFDEVSNMIRREFGQVRNSSSFDLYSSVKFFYEKHCGAKSEREFYVTNWMVSQEIYSRTSRESDIKTMSLIVNGKFYQSQVRKELEELRTNILKPEVFSIQHRILNKLCYVYLFLYVFPNEYDRSINLYRLLDQFPCASGSYMWGTFSDAIRNHGNQVSKFLDYFRKRITPQMFINWILEEAEIRQKRAYDTTIRDTVEMMETVYRRTSYMTNVNPELTKQPKRWRLLDTHDHYCGIVLQMDNALKKLPTDLIAEPTEFSTELGNIKLFQPATNHEVIRWGKAVRNCVGSAGYDDRVLKRQAFLVFAERNGKPWVTSLLTLRAGLLQVGQTVAPFNGNLKQEEMAVYHKCLGEILTAQAN